MGTNFSPFSIVRHSIHTGPAESQRRARALGGTGVHLHLAAMGDSSPLLGLRPGPALGVAGAICAGRPKRVRFHEGLQIVVCPHHTTCTCDVAPGSRYYVPLRYETAIKNRADDVRFFFFFFPTRGGKVNHKKWMIQRGISCSVAAHDWWTYHLSFAPLGIICLMFVDFIRSLLRTARGTLFEMKATLI